MYIHFMVQKALEEAAARSTEEQAKAVYHHAPHRSNGGEWESTSWETKDEDTVQVSEEVDW